MNSRQEIKKILVEALRLILGKKAPSVIDDDVEPIGHLGLVSADGIDLVLELEARLGISIGESLNPLVADENHRRRPRKVREIVDWLVKVQQEQ